MCAAFDRIEMKPRLESATIGMCLGGTNENSTAFQRRVSARGKISPKGTVEKGLARPSLRDLRPLTIKPKVETLGYFQPSLRDGAFQILAAVFLPGCPLGRCWNGAACARPPPPSHRPHRRLRLQNSA